MALLTKDRAKAVGALRFEDVPVPEWGDGVVVRVRTMPLSLMSELPTIAPAEQSAWLISQTAIDENGEPLYSWPGDKEFLLSRDGPGGERISRVAFGLFRVDEKKIVEAQKNESPSGGPANAQARASDGENGQRAPGKPDGG